MTKPAAVLFGTSGLRIDGGIASVARTVARVFDEEVDAGRIGRSDRVMLFEDPGNAYPAPSRGFRRFANGSQARMAALLWWSYVRHRHDLVLFDHLGVARVTQIPLPGFSPRYAIFCMRQELMDVRESGSRRRVLQNAWRLLAISEETAEVLRNRVPEVADRIRVTPLCIDPERIDNWRKLSAPPTSPREPAALIVARMSHDEAGKGHKTMIEAWSTIRRRVPDAELWIAGDGDGREALEDLARRKAPEGSVRFLGRVPDAELSELYCRASLYSMPSRQEGFGLVYTEAMWHGLPCIGSNADAAREIIDDGETGLLIPYGDVEATANALSSLLADPDRRARMGELAFSRVRERFLFPNFRRVFLDALELPSSD